MSSGKLNSTLLEKLSSAKSIEELEAIAFEEGIELSDEVLDEIAGGWDVHMFDDSRHVYPQGGKPSVLP